MPTNTKTALLDSAERAARKQGFDGFSYADLASEVGINKASIHYHFPTKATLSFELMQRYHLTFKAICAEIDEAEDTGGAKLRALIDRYRVGTDNGKSLCLCVSFSISRESLPPEVIAQIGEFRSMMINWVETAFEDGLSDKTIKNIGNPKEEAAAVLPLLEGAQLAARATENGEMFERAIVLLLSRLH